jgi:hypothetical protein
MTDHEILNLPAGEYSTNMLGRYLAAMEVAVHSYDHSAADADVLPRAIKRLRELLDLAGQRSAAVQSEGLTPTFADRWACCRGCQKRQKIKTLAPIERLLDRMDPGGAIPAGQCPACGDLSFAVIDDRWPDLPKADLLEAAAEAWAFISQLGLGNRGSSICGKVARAMDQERRRREGCR